MQLKGDLLDLIRLQLCRIASFAMVEQSRESSLPIGTAPGEEAADRTGTDVTDLLDPIPAAIEAHGLIASFGIRLLAMQIGGLKGIGLRFAEDEGASFHAFYYATLF